jgi:hypothetical protein
MDHWAYWINEPIFVDRGTQYAKRKHAIYSFCKDGLIPLVESAGYKFQYPDSKLFHLFLTFLYKLYEGHTVQPLVVEMPHRDEQSSHFHYKLDTERWQYFWKKWGSIQDFDEGGYAQRLQYELAEFVWSWIDFEKSRSVEEVYDEIEQEEYRDELTKGKDDPYLQETSKRDYQDRHW